MGRTLGDGDDPLLVSVRSGAKFSMPGMMETVLDIGLGDASVEGLARQTGDPRFAWDSYRRLVQMYGRTVLDLDGDRFEDAIDAAKAAKGVTSDVDLDADDLRALVATFKQIVAEDAGSPFPQDPREQLRGAVLAVFDSWNSDRAVLYRRRERIPADLGTAVNVQAMAFGNRGASSGSGVAFTRDPSTGAVGVYGDYLQDAQGEDVVAGIRNTLALADLESIDKASYDELLDIMAPPRGPLPRHVRHRVHHRAGPPVDAADPGRQAHRRGGVPHRRRPGRRGGHHRGGGPACGSPATSSPS